MSDGVESTCSEILRTGGVVTGGLGVGLTPRERVWGARSDAESAPTIRSMAWTLSRPDGGDVGSGFASLTVDTRVQMVAQGQDSSAVGPTDAEVTVRRPSRRC